MKQIIVTLTILSLSSSIYSQGNEVELGRVKKVNGIETYIMCEPLRDYEVLVDVATGVKAESVITGGLVNKSISGRVEQFVNRAKKENANVEAIVYTSGKRVVGVKFKDVGTEQNKSIARPSKMKGRPVFVMCEPLKSYTSLQSKGGGVKWKSAMTAGLINNSIEEDVEKIVGKLEGEKDVDAFYFDGTKEGEGISFKK